MTRAANSAFMLSLLCGLALLLVPGTGSALDALQGEIRFTPAREGTVWVGEKLELNLELWTTGYSFGDQLFALPEVPGGYLLQADSTTIKLSETRDGVAWQGLRYALFFYPQRAGRLEVPPFEVGFSASAGYGSEPARFDDRTPALAIDARLPPGADGGGLLVTTGSFGMEASWSPRIEPGEVLELKVGDSLTLTVEREAGGVPGMVFAPLPVYSAPGLGAYPETPRVNDRVDRGSLTGLRTDSITWIFEKEGEYSLPALEFQWWDPGKEQLSDRSVPAVNVSVAANPAYAGSAASGTGSGEAIRWKPLLVTAMTVLVGFFLAWLLLPGLKGGGLARLATRAGRLLRRMFRKVVKPARVLPPLNP